ncbi:LuxR C-terminal-related transcriptional regulator [Streptomyces sp. NPDC046821]|uniref:ATP-binding protein n=1 Tax=Streptomyces sp. NPDC046821 TaxID=3154702 RepID=UPI00340721B5
MSARGLAQAPQRRGSRPGPGIQAPPPPPPVRRAATGGLPYEVTSFVGRGREITTIKRALANSRLVTLLGVGGVGKTRLMLHSVGALTRTFPDGVRLVELAHLQEPSLLEQTVARALGIRETPGPVTPEDLLEHLADKQVLLVLDNCEHLLDECASLVDTLLRNTPRLRVLATSREALCIQGESIVDVRPLACPEPGEPADPADVARYPAAGLLLDRVAAVRPEFTLNHGNAEAVAQLCRRLDGLPLAIELAAVRARTLTVQQIVDRLDDRFVLLRAGLRGGDVRQRTMEALIDWSFELCDARERTLWARLSVFSGGFEVGDAEEVCSGDGLSRSDVTEALFGLVGKSIVSRNADGAESRLYLLETIREYGRLRLAERGEELTFRRRHRDMFCGLARQADREWYSRNQLSWAVRLTQDHANIRAALTFSYETPGEERAGLRLNSALRSWSTVAGLLTECRQWLARGLDRYRERDATRAWALLADAGLAMYQGEAQEAETIFAEARELIAGLDDARLRAHLLTAAGQHALYQTRPGQAIKLLREALTDHESRADSAGLIESLLPLALSSSVTGDSETAVELCERVEQICVDRGEYIGRSYALWTRAMETWRNDDFPRTKQLLQESLRFKSRFDDCLGIALCFEGLAWVAVVQGQVDRAAKLLGANEPVSRQLGLSLGKCRHLMEHFDRCRRRIAEADQTLVQAAYDEGAAMSLANAIAYALESDPTRTPRTAPTDTEHDLHLLTPREREVAQLVTAGLTNRAIAAHLVISRRTAEGHVERILAKLGFTSRAQIASWFTSRGTGTR